MRSLEKTTHPGQYLLDSLYLIPGREIKLIKIVSLKKSDIPVGTTFEGVLDNEIILGKPIYIDNGSKNTTSVIGVKKDGGQIFIKTDTSIYELMRPSPEVPENNRKSRDFIEREKEIGELLERAKSNALDVGEIMTLINKRQVLSYKQNRTIEDNNEIMKIDEKMEKCIITVETISDFKILMEKTGKNYYSVIGTVEHENAHANKALSLGGIHHGYSLIVGKDTDGFSYQPIALTDVPEYLDEGEKIEKNLEILNAPKEYGNKLSPEDEKNIKFLKDRLMNL